jgi:hypothetical protein
LASNKTAMTPSTILTLIIVYFEFYSSSPTQSKKDNGNEAFLKPIRTKWYLVALG